MTETTTIYFDSDARTVYHPCGDCGHEDELEVGASLDVPHHSDDDAWAEIQGAHGAACEWAQSRAYHIDIRR